MSESTPKWFNGCRKKIKKITKHKSGAARFTDTKSTCQCSVGATVPLIRYNNECYSSHLHCGVTPEGDDFITIGNNLRPLKVHFHDRHLPLSLTAGDYQVEIKKNTHKTSDDDKSESREEATIRKHHAYLVEELRNSDLVTYLFQEGTLSLADKDDIDDQLTRQRKIEMVLDKVMRACPEAYLIFLRGLEQEHAHVANTLQNPDTYVCFSWLPTQRTRL